MTIFKKGDKIRVLDVGQIWFANGRISNGGEYEVDSWNAKTPSNVENIKIKDDKDKLFTITINEFKHIEKVENHKFKIGDKVRVISASHGWGPVKKGDKGVIVTVPERENGIYAVELKSYSRWNGYERCFELIEKKQSKREQIEQLKELLEIHEKELKATKQQLEEIEILKNRIAQLEKEIQDLKEATELKQPISVESGEKIDQKYDDFKIGDEVKVVRNTADWGSKVNVGYHESGQGVVKIGSTGVVEKIDGNFVIARFEGEHVINISGHMKLRKDEIEKTHSTITFEGTEYKKVNREAQDGDVIIITKKYNDLSNAFEVGQPYLVKPDVTITSSHWALNGYSYDVYNKGVRDTENIDVYERVTPLQSINDQRKAIIEEAKKYVEDKLKPNTCEDDWNRRGAVKGFANVGSVSCIPTFKVLDKKIQLQLIGAGSGREYKTITTTCSHNDVFNVHIGKAIAVARAFGEDATRFEQAVQPDEIVVGMVVEMANFPGYTPKGKTIRVTKVENNKIHHDEGHYNADRHERFNFALAPVIVDDTNAEY